MSAQIEILREQEGQRGWTFDVQVLDDEGALTKLELRLAWADYNLWSRGGSDPPGWVAEAVMRFLLARMPAREIPAALDAALARRLFHDADQHIPAYIAG